MKKIAILTFIFFASNISVYSMYDSDIKFTKTTIDYGKINKAKMALKFLNSKIMEHLPLK